MLKLLSIIKLVLYALVLTRAFRATPLSVPLVAIASVLVISGLSRSLFDYKRYRLNIISLHLDLILAILFSLFTQNGSFDKFFLVYIIEGIAVLPKPYWFIYLFITLIADAGCTAVYDLKLDGQVQFPEFAQILLYGLIIVLVSGERRQREQRAAHEKLAKELGYVNLQLKESAAWGEALACETERRRIAGEIHDSLGHDLTGLIITLEAGKKLMSCNAEVDLEYWNKALQISRTALNSVRELVSAGTEADTGFELTSSLKEMVKEVRNLTGLNVELQFEFEDMELSEKEQFNVYRIFQEAITNTLRHGHADHACINISHNQELIFFSYVDNGKGIDQIEPGNGLKGMMARIAEINGSIKFQSEIGCGFRIEACIDRRGIK